MCEGDDSGCEWHSFLADMIERGESVLSFTEGLEIEEFAKDERTFKATLWDLGIIGEAARRIPDQVKRENRHIDWRQIIGMRNRITHGYQAIDTDIVWDTIKTDIPPMLADLRDLLNRIDHDTP